MNRSSKQEYLCIVDDELQVCKALKREIVDFTSANNLEIKLYTNPLICLEELEEIGHDTALIISDLRMPQLKGSDFLSEVHSKYPDIELMLLTAYNDISDIQKAISATLRALILKPWSIEILISELENALEIRRIKEQNKVYVARLNKQLEIAGDFQQKLLETEIPDIENARIDLTYIPLPRMKIGGDYYDMIKIDQNRFLAMIGDVTGHGVKPSFVTAMIKVLSLSLSGSVSMDRFTPASFMSVINNKLCQVLKNTQDILITFTCFLVDTKNMLLTLSNAGHFPICIVNQNRCEVYKVEGPAMGFSAGINYLERQINLNKGDTIAVYTDGLLESENEHSKIDAGVIKRFLIQAKGSEDFNKAFIDQLKLVRSLESFYDDVTVLSVTI
jgi:sigma-B regulation protein RsbU (phosphoserine phosphatase)